MAGRPEEGVRAFVGRPEVVDQLRRREDEVRGGRGGLTLVFGEAGVGKSTLLRSFREEWAARGLLLLVGAAGGLDNPPPLQLVRDALASGPGGARRPGPDEAGGSSLASLVPSPPSRAVMIGFAAPPEDWAGPRPPGEEQLLEAVGRSGEPPEGPKPKPFQALADQLRRVVERGPTVVVLEDLHRADDLSLDFLEFLGPDLARHPLWVVGTSLPLEQLPEARRARLERLLRELHGEEVRVPPLTAQETPEFVQGLRPGWEPDPFELARWHAQSGGNPLFLERMVRGSRQLPVPEPRPSEGDDEAPERVARQLAELPPDEARVLSVAAVLGHAFPFALLWSATGEEEERLTEEVEGLVGRGILREGADEGLEFVHEELRGRLYASLTVSRRRILHRKAGEALEEQGAADPATIYALALHCFLGRLDDRAAVYNRAAAELAVHQGSPTVARLHLERALEAHRHARPGDAAGELELLLELAVQLDRLGELREADRLLSEAFQRPALRHAASPAQRALASLYRARILTDQGRWGEADQLTQELLGSADVRAGPETLLRAHRLRGELLYYRGEYAQALSHHEEALRLAHRLRDDREIALEMVRKANVLGMMPGRAAEALAACRLAAETLVRLGDLGEAAYATLFLGVIESQQGQVEAGIDHLRKALTLAEEGHDPRRTGWARFNLADLERERGRLEVARRHNETALRTLTEVGDRFGVLQVQIINGKIGLAAKEYGAAELALLEGFRLARELQTPADELEVLVRLAEVAQARGDPGGARARLASAETIGFARRPDLSEDVARLRATLGEERGATTAGA